MSVGAVILVALGIVPVAFVGSPRHSWELTPLKPFGQFVVFAMSSKFSE
jgi:hypothetical protein